MVLLPEGNALSRQITQFTPAARRPALIQPSQLNGRRYWHQLMMEPTTPTPPKPGTPASTPPIIPPEHRLPRKPIWGERGEDGSAPKRDVLVDKVPSLGDAPWYVRMWLAAYMRYRGLSDSLAENVHYTGAELQALDSSSVAELFTTKCGLEQREAEILGRDVWEMVQVGGASSIHSSLAPLIRSTHTIQAKSPLVPKPTQLDRYAKFVGEDATQLRQISAPKTSIFRRIGSFLLWTRALLKTIALTYVGTVFAFVSLACLSAYLSPEGSQMARGRS